MEMEPAMYTTPTPKIPNTTATTEEATIKDSLTFQVVWVFLNVLTIILHSFGLFLLYRVKAGIHFLIMNLGLGLSLQHLKFFPF